MNNQSFSECVSTGRDKCTASRMALVPLVTVRVKEDNFKPEEVAELLNISTEVMSKIISVPPCLPKAGEAYLVQH